MLERSVRCFEQQTYPQRELIIVYDTDDTDTAAWVSPMAATRGIRGIQAGIGGTQTLGELRNLSISSARGEFIAQWDDDDWHAPERLERQLAGLLNHPRACGCVLTRWLIHDGVTGLTYVSARRPWEGSLVARRATLPPYPLLSRGEDTQVISAILRSGTLVSIDHPTLYIYCYHGNNTWDRAHFERNVVAHAHPLYGSAANWVIDRVIQPIQPL